MFQNFGSIASFKILMVVALVTCITQIIISQLIYRFSKKEDTRKDEYRKVATKNNAEDVLTAF